MQLEDVIVVTNDIEYEIPTSGLVIAYFVHCADHEIEMFKAEICRIWRMNNELMRTDSPIAGMLRGGLHPLFCIKLQNIRNYGATHTESDYLYDKNINPIICRGLNTTQLALFLWGIKLVKDGFLLSSISFKDARQNAATIELLIAQGVEFIDYSYQASDVKHDCNRYNKEEHF